jgi:hypothetical protein
MNITKEQMLERIREWKGAFDTHPDKMDEWSLCFMEDYEVYDAIRSLIESSSPSGSIGKAEGEKESGQLRAGDFGKAGEPLVTIDGAGNIKKHLTPSPGPSVEISGVDFTQPGTRMIIHPAPLPAEVEEAMETLTMLVEVDGDVLENAALAVIRAALTATIKPTLTVAPTIQVTREWLTGAIGTIAFRAFTCENHRALVDCIEQDMARLEEMLRELGIEVEP